MKRLCISILVVIAVAVGLSFIPADPVPRTEPVVIINNSRFGPIRVSGSSNTGGVLIINFSGPSPDESTKRYINDLVMRGNIVAEVDIERYRSIAQAENGGGILACYEYAGEVSRLSQVLQNSLKMETISSAILLGTGERGSEFAFAIQRFLKSDFFGALATSLPVGKEVAADLCSDEDLNKFRADYFPLNVLDDKEQAPSYSNFRFLLSSGVPVTEIASRRHVSSSFLECSGAHCPLIDLFVPRPQMGQARLPVIEVLPKSDTSDFFVVFLSGDGGWASIDKEISGYLRKRGVPVVGFDSLKYFWKAKSPERVAADISSLVTEYRRKFGKKRVVLLGFSLGADVIPFILSRLPSEQLSSISYYSLLSGGLRVEFEVKLTDWISDDQPESGAPIAPELEHVPNIPASCIRGKEEESSLCDQKLPSSMTTFTLPGSHHFDGDYERVAEILVKEIETRALR